MRSQALSGFQLHDAFAQGEESFPNGVEGSGYLVELGFFRYVIQRDDLFIVAVHAQITDHVRK